MVRTSTIHGRPRSTGEDTTVCVVGLGYIGLPTALLLARTHSVVGVDIDDERVASLEAGSLPFEEPGLTTLFESTRDRFSARTSIPGADTEDTVTDSSAIDTYLIAAPTPLDPIADVADLTHIRTATESVAEVLGPGDTVILESTVPPGTTDRLLLPILEQSRAGSDGFYYAHCPERALPGNTIQEIVTNDRVIGGMDAESSVRVKELYDFVDGTIYTTDPTSAEFVKLIENTYRDVNIALANELGTLASQYGIDGRAAIALANRHPRVDILSPGPGVGGHCLPIDPQFLTQRSTDSRLISLARSINDMMPVHVLRSVREMVAARPGTRITVLGVAYKGGVGDTRETPALRFLRLAENEGYDVCVHDPHVGTFDYPIEELAAAVDGSDCLVVVTDHPEFAELDPATLAASMHRPNVLDTRGLIDRDEWEAAGFTVRRLADGS